MEWWSGGVVERRSYGVVKCGRMAVAEEPAERRRKADSAAQGGAAPATGEGVREEYRRRLAERRAALDRLTRADRSLSGARLAVFAAMTVAFWAAYAVDERLVWLGAALLAAFAWLVVRHDRTLRARERAERAVRFYERGAERLEDR